MGMTLVTGATGFVARTSRGRSFSAATTCASRVRASSSRAALEGLDVDVAVAQLGDRAALRRALRGVDRVFHVAGRRTCGIGDRAAARQRRGHPAGDGGIAAGGRRARRPHLVDRARSGRAAARRGRRAQRVPARARRALRRVQARGGDRGAPGRRARAPGRDRLPRARVRPRRPRAAPRPASCAASCCAGSPPTCRRDQRRRRPDVAAGHLLADERGTPGERYILGTRNYTWDRLFAELERLSGIEGPALELPVGVALALAEAGAHGPLPAIVSPAEVRAAGLWWTCKSTKARRELGWTTRPHEDTVEDDGALVGGAARRPDPAGAPRAAARPGSSSRWPRAPRRESVAGSPLSPSCSTAAARRPTGCAPAAGSRARCGAGLRGRGAARAVAPRRARRRRRAHRPARGPGRGPRPRGDLRLPPHPRAPALARGRT